MNDGRTDSKPYFRVAIRVTTIDKIDGTEEELARSILHETTDKDAAGRTFDLACGLLDGQIE